MVTMKHEEELGLSGSESVIRFAIRSMVLPFWVVTAEV